MYNTVPIYLAERAGRAVSRVSITPIDGFMRAEAVRPAPEGLRNYGKAAAAALETLKKLRRGSRFQLS